MSHSRRSCSAGGANDEGRRAGATELHPAQADLSHGVAPAPDDPTRWLLGAADDAAESTGSVTSGGRRAGPQMAAPARTFRARRTQ